MTQQQDVDVNQRAGGKILGCSMFVEIFSDPANVLELYRSVHPEDTAVCLEDIHDIHIESVQTEDLDNDLAFRVRDQLMLFSDEPVIYPLMMDRFVYFYGDRVEGHHHYQINPAPLQDAELWILYYGPNEEKFSGHQIIRVHEKGMYADHEVTLRARIMTESSLEGIGGEYLAFRRILDGLTEDRTDWNAVSRHVIELCVEQGILQDFFLAHREEITELLSHELFQMETIRNTSFVRRQEGERRGASRCLVQMIDRVTTRKGISVRKACEMIGCSRDDYVAAQRILDQTDADPKWMRGRNWAEM